MLISEITDAECRETLSRMNFGRLACARDNQPYVVPVYFAYDGEHLYTLATLGQKIEWMRANPFVCVEVDEVKSHDQWMSIIIFGRYEEIPDDPEEGQDMRQHACELLQNRVMWWQPAYVASTHRGHPHSLEPIFYRIHIASITGHRASPDMVEDAAAPSATMRVKMRNWLHDLLHPSRSKN